MAYCKTLCTGRVTLCNEHSSCKMFVAPQNQYAQQRNVQNGHCCSRLSQQGEEVNYCGNNNVVKKNSLLLLVFGGGVSSHKSGPKSATLTEFCNTALPLRTSAPYMDRFILNMETNGTSDTSVPATGVRYKKTTLSIHAIGSRIRLPQDEVNESHSRRSSNTVPGPTGAPCYEDVLREGTAPLRGTRWRSG
jgi:hypothetical protein